ncbi:MAG: sugar transferase [Planctomycetes bacterium]|nr:sugar transferase [Planctomycetota bacterium]
MSVASQSSQQTQTPPSFVPQPIAGMGSHSFRLAASTSPSWRVGQILLLADVVGILACALLCLALGMRDANSLVPGLTLWPIQLAVMYLAGSYRVGALDSVWSTPARCLLAALIAKSLHYLGQQQLGWSVAASFPLWGFSVVWPVFTRLLVGHWWRSRAGRVRWLAIGPRECLAQLHHDRISNAKVGDIVYISREPADARDDDPLPISGSLNSIDTWLNRRWTGIIVADADRLPDTMTQRLMTARLAGIRVTTLSDFYERQWRKVPIYHLHDGWFALSQGFDLLHHPMGLRLKRMMDIACAMVLLIVSSPVVAITAIAIKLTSAGPVLFRQERVGRGGVVFTMLKFRTMRVGSESGDRYTQKKDARVTLIGRFLRRSRLDELPQLWNVLIGEMSFIGPRAEWTRCVSEYENEIPFYQLRHLLKPGLTGWAQVNYPYGASIEDAREKLQYDFFYIKNHSLWLDLLILLKTVRVVLYGFGSR